MSVGQSRSVRAGVPCTAPLVTRIRPLFGPSVICIGGQGQAVMFTACPNQDVPRPESVAGRFEGPGVPDEITEF